MTADLCLDPSIVTLILTWARVTSFNALLSRCVTGLHTLGFFNTPYFETLVHVGDLVWTEVFAFLW